MLFNSVVFFVFLPIVFVLYWFVFNRKIKLQNIFLTVASYVFYGWWDWRFLSLIIFSSVVDFKIGQRLEFTEKKRFRKLLLWISIAVNIGLLGIFKYYNFFIENFASLLGSLGLQANFYSLRIILPVGISFYTFQTLSYTIDVYRKKLKPSNDIIQFLAYVSFFPQLVAGPIERAINLLPQFSKKRLFNYKMGRAGLQLIIWGFFKKVVIADNCAVGVDKIFFAPEEFSGIVLVFGAILFAFQIYGDFSGYSDIAIGLAKLFGFNLMRNFAYPYFSRDIAEFWRRWHISLSTWFRDYLYIPLGGSRSNKVRVIINIFIIFIVSGLWHGANWTFLFWGFLNALYFLPLLLTKANRKNIEIVATSRTLPTIREFFQIMITFCLTCFAWIFFRAETMQQAMDYIVGLFRTDGNFYIPVLPFFLIALMLVIEWFARRQENVFEVKIPSFLRRISYVVILLIIIVFGVNESQGFIYFQF